MEGAGNVICGIWQNKFSIEPESFHKAKRAGKGAPK